MSTKPDHNDEPKGNAVVTPLSKPRSNSNSEPTMRKLTLSEHNILRQQAKRKRKSAESARKRKEVQHFLKIRQQEIDGQKRLDQIYDGQLENDGVGKDECKENLEILLTKPHPFDVDIVSSSSVRISERRSFESYLDSKQDAALEQLFNDRHNKSVGKACTKKKHDVTEFKEEVLCR